MNSTKIENGVYGSYSERDSSNQKVPYTKVHYSSLKLRMIGDTSSTAGQSSQTPYKTNYRNITEQLQNLQLFQRSLDESNTSESPLSERAYDTHTGGRYPYVSSHAHEPFYRDVSRILPEQLQRADGLTHKASLVYYEIVGSNLNQSTERILPIIEVLYNPGYTSSYRWNTVPAAHRFELQFNHSGGLGRVSLKFPPIKIYWNRQKLVDTKTLGIRTVSTGTSRKDYLTRLSNNRFKALTLNLNTVDLDQDFPITNENALFYVSFLSADDVNPYYDMTINTYVNTPSATNPYRKKCLTVTEDDDLAMKNCVSNNLASEPYRWKYTGVRVGTGTNNRLDSNAEQTICLYDRVASTEEEVPAKKCLYRGIDNYIRVGDYNDEEISITRFKWEVIDYMNELASLVGN